MTDDRAAPSADLVRALALAMDAGSEAESALQPIAVPDPPLEGQGSRFLGLAARWPRRVLTTPPADQVRRACGHLDEFARALAELAGHIEDDPLAEVSDRAAGWSDLVWAKRSNAATVYNDVRSAAALLVRYRTNLILERPITGS